jgi:hypothetical protein
MIAVECLNKCIDLCADNADVQTQLAVLYLNTGRDRIGVL